MKPIHKHIVTDESLHPIAVQIDYDDWLEIEKELNLTNVKEPVDLSRFDGVITLDEDPLEFQKRIR